MPPVEFPDVEAMAREFLRARLTPPVSSKVPNPRPARYVRAWRSGGAAANRVVDHPLITVSCTADGSVQAREDANDARTAFLNEYTAMPLVRGVEEQVGIYFDPDPDTGEDRYSFTMRLTVRGRRP